MGTTKQRARKAARDKKKRWDALVSSILVTTAVSESISREMIMSFVKTAHELQLPIASLIGLEALKVADRNAERDKLIRSNDALEKQLVHTRGLLRQAQETISNRNVQFMRRQSRKARAHHPEKRR